MPSQDEMRQYQAEYEADPQVQSAMAALEQRVRGLAAAEERPRRKPMLCLDFDGVCHSYTSGWQGATVIPDLPVPGLFEFLEAVSAHFTVAVHSSRSHEEGGVGAMVFWFGEHWSNWARETGRLSDPQYRMPALEFPQYKPSAFVTLDDRAITFTGAWPSVETLRAFKPWNKR